MWLCGFVALWLCGFVAVVLGAFALFAFVMFWFTIPTNMAEERGRSAGFWILIGFLTTTLVSIGLLWLLGPKVVTLPIGKDTQ